MHRHRFRALTALFLVFAMVHTIFGEVSGGDEVLDAIALRYPQAQPTGPPTWLETIEIIEA